MPSSSRKPMLPSTPPKLIFPRSEAQQKLEAHIEKGRVITQRTITSEAEMAKAKADGDKWRDYSIALLEALFDNPVIADEYKNKTRQLVIVEASPFLEEQNYFKDRMNTWWIKELESILERLDLIQENPTIYQNSYMPNGIRDTNSQVEALRKIEQIANRFHTVARQLRKRHAGRDTLIISDEYDVQDLFHSLLRMFFDDIRDEEWTPSYAGGASRIDFLLKNEQVLVEIKMTRSGLAKEKDVSDQLIIDSERYRIHPDCKTLVVFVYDPLEYLNNPKGIEYDLTKTINNIPITVFVRSH